jgi:hypothetical protein
LVASKRGRGPRLRGALLLRGRGNVGEMGARRRGRTRFRVEVCDAREPSSTRGVRLPPREHATIAVGVRSCGLPSRLSGKRSALRAWACPCGPSAGGRAGLASRPARGAGVVAPTEGGGTVAGGGGLAAAAAAIVGGLVLRAVAALESRRRSQAEKVRCVAASTSWRKSATARRCSFLARRHWLSCRRRARGFGRRGRVAGAAGGRWQCAAGACRQSPRASGPGAGPARRSRVTVGHSRPRISLRPQAQHGGRLCVPALVQATTARHG